MNVKMLSKRKLLHSLRELFKIQNSEEVFHLNIAPLTIQWDTTRCQR